MKSEVTKTIDALLSQRESIAADPAAFEELLVVVAMIISQAPGTDESSLRRLDTHIDSYNSQCGPLGYRPYARTFDAIEARAHTPSPAAPTPTHK